MIRFFRYAFIGIVLLLAGAVPGGAESVPDVPEGAPEKEDVLFFRNGDILRGRILNESFRILTPYALVDVPLHACAGVSLNGPEEEADSLFTANFNRFSGNLVDRTLRFKSVHAASELMIRIENVQRIRCGRTGEEGRAIGARDKTDLFVMNNGDLLTGRPGEATFRLKRGRDEWSLPFSQVRSLRIRDGKAEKTRVRTRRGETIHASLVTEAVSLLMDIGTVVDPLYLDQCATVFFGDGNRRAAEHFPQVSHESMTDPDLLPRKQEPGILTNSIGMKLKRIEPGTFLMGSSRGHPDEAPEHRVAMTKPYYIGINEVTQGQWEEVMGDNPSYWKDPLRPVERVSWNDARRFCRRLSDRENREYRLPTEAEWAYACRAGTSSAYPWGEDFLEDHAWCSVNARETTHEVGTRKPNPWGLYDMNGNVWEWCEDVYKAYPGGKIPVSRRQDDEERVLRGGGWFNVPERCRTESRNHLGPDYGVSSTTGFRVLTGAREETDEEQGIAR